MTLQTKLEEIRKKCVEANPEIMELTFGCVVKPRYHPATTRVCEDYPDSLIQCESEILERRDVEILGRPIRLADVLLAMGEAPKNTKIVVDDHGVFWDMNTLENSTIQPESFHWKLPKDDLTLQSDETIDFLHSILCPKGK